MGLLSSWAKLNSIFIWSDEPKASQKLNQTIGKEFYFSPDFRLKNNWQQKMVGKKGNEQKICQIFANISTNYD